MRTWSAAQLEASRGQALGEALPRTIRVERTAYEASMRVPLVGVCPTLWKPGTKVEQVVANIDIAPTILEAAGLKSPAHMDGQSFLQLAAGKADPSEWRQHILYEYYWEYNFPHTPTTFALRTERYKFINYLELAGMDELYDLETDPFEMNNLIGTPAGDRLLPTLQAELARLQQSSNYRADFAGYR